MPVNNISEHQENYSNVLNNNTTLKHNVSIPYVETIKGLVSEIKNNTFVVENEVYNLIDNIIFEFKVGDYIEFKCFNNSLYKYIIEVL